jgi:hypothetical protein
MATFATPVRTGLAAVLAAIQAQLVLKAVVADPSHVLMVARQNVPHYTAEKDVLLWPRGFSVSAKMVAAGGRTTTKLTRTISTVCRTRLHLDEAGRDKVWLTHATLGLLALEEAVADALQLFSPTQGGAALLCEPMRLLRGDSMGKEEGRDRDVSWGLSALDWEVAYLLNINQSVQ